MRQAILQSWMFAACLLAVSLVLGSVSQADARRGRGHYGFHVGARHRHHRHHHFHHHHGLHHFFGFHYYGYPYPYRPYYYYAEPYYPAEHRRFPAFRMPAFLHYPGALAKGEEEGAP